MKIGYARVSTRDQNLDLQIDALKDSGCEKIFMDRITGAKKERPELQKVLENLRTGDVLVTWKLDRLGRSLQDLKEIVEGLERQGIGFKSLKEEIDTSSSTGKLIFHIFSSLAEFERDIIRERTNAGLQAARIRGRVGGRPKVLNDKKITLARAMMADRTIQIKDICSALGVSKATLYRYVKDDKKIDSGATSDL